MKSVNDTTAVRLITNNDESTYRAEVRIPYFFNPKKYGTATRDAGILPLPLYREHSNILHLSMVLQLHCSRQEVHEESLGCSSQHCRKSSPRGATERHLQGCHPPFELLPSGRHHQALQMDTNTEIQLFPRAVTALKLVKAPKIQTECHLLQYCSIMFTVSYLFILDTDLLQLLSILFLLIIYLFIITAMLQIHIHLFYLFQCSLMIQLIHSPPDIALLFILYVCLNEISIYRAANLISLLCMFLCIAMRIGKKDNDKRYSIVFYSKGLVKEKSGAERILFHWLPKSS